MTVTRRRAGCDRVRVRRPCSAAGCAQPTTGTPRADRRRGREGHRGRGRHAGSTRSRTTSRTLGDEHAAVYNYLNYGDLKITTEHESFKVGDPPVDRCTKRRYAEDGDWSETLTPPESKVDYVKLDEDHAFLAPTPWVSVPSLSRRTASQTATC